MFVFYYYLCKKYYKPIIVKRYTANCVSWVLVLSPCSCVWICATLWTIASQAPLSRGFSRQEYWSGLPCLQGISLTQGWNPSLLRLLRWQAGSLLLVVPGKPIYIVGLWPNSFSKGNDKWVWREVACSGLIWTSLPLWHKLWSSSNVFFILYFSHIGISRAFVLSWLLLVEKYSFCF